MRSRHRDAAEEALAAELSASHRALELMSRCADLARWRAPSLGRVASCFACDEGTDTGWRPEWSRTANDAARLTRVLRARFGIDFGRRPTRSAVTCRE
jgi:hypothetical protein